MEAACRVPLGWSIGAEGLVSPWSTLEQPSWPAEARAEGPWACIKTGRPVLLAGEQVKMTVEPVPPVKEVEFSNPDGDGEFKITLTNTGKEAATIPALLKQGDEILWRESLVIVCQGKGYAVPGAAGVKAETEPVQLAAGESLSTTVNVLGLDGPEWPRGGYRIEFQFCLGEVGESYSLYYMSRHHDPLRAKFKP